MCECTELGHDEVRRAILAQGLKSIALVREALGWKTPDGCQKCRPALNYYLLCAWPENYRDDPQSRFVNERVHANIQKDGTYSVVPRMWGGLTTPGELRAIADAAEKYAIPTVKVTGGQRIDLLGVKKEAAAGGLGRSQQGRAGLGPRLRQGAAHGEDLRRQRMVPLRHPGFDRPRRQDREDVLGFVDPAQGQARGLRLPAQLRRSDHQGYRRRLRRGGLRSGRRRQWRRRGSGYRPSCPCRHRSRGARAYRRLPAALSRGGPLSRADGALGRPHRHRLRRRRIVEDAAGRRALHHRFLVSQRAVQTDPWAQRAGGDVAAHEYRALAEMG